MSNKYLIITLFFFLSQTVVSCSSDIKPAEEEKNGEMLKIGAWYFGGWSFPPDEYGYTFHISPTLVTQYSNREPVWGWREDNMDIMVDQINYAADAGLSFLGFCWYETTLVEDPKAMDMLNNALDLFTKAPNKNRLDFFLLSCFPVSPKNWDILCDKTIALFSEPNYLRVDGKPIIIFFNTDEIIDGMGGTSEMETALNEYRKKVRDKGIGEIIIGARTVTVPNLHNYQKKLELCGFDFLTTYQNSNEGRMKAGANDYGNLINGDKIVWDNVSANTDLKYIPVMGTGYDMRPWAIDHPTIPFSDFWYTGATPTRIANHLRDAVNWVKSNKEKVLNNMIIMYAWNENAEGGWLTPTKSEGNSRLEEIEKVIKEVNNEK